MSRTFEQIFEYIQTTDVDYYAVKCSYLEIYNEEIRDLLHKQNGRKLDVKEHPEKGDNLVNPNPDDQRIFLWKYLGY